MLDPGRTVYIDRFELYPVVHNLAKLLSHCRRQQRLRRRCIGEFDLLCALSRVLNFR